MLFLRSKGIVISKTDVEEADRYITVFMEEFGKVSVFVKGIRKSKKRDKTAVDILSETDFLFHMKNENIILSDFFSIDNYKNIKKDIEKLNVALYIFSVLNQVLVENGKNRGMYTLLEKTLRYLDKTEDMRKNYLLIVYFLYQIIKNEGIDTGKNVDFFIEEINKKVSILAKEILKSLFDEKLKRIIDDEKYEFIFIKEFILLLEFYINKNLDIGINAEKMLWGAWIW